MVARGYYLDYIDWYREIRIFSERHKSIKYEFAEEITKMVSLWAYLLYKHARSRNNKNIRTLDPKNVAQFKDKFYKEQIQFCTNIQEEIFALSWPHEVDYSIVKHPMDINYMKITFYNDLDDIIRSTIGCIGKLLIAHGFEQNADKTWIWNSQKKSYIYAYGIPKGLKSYRFRRLKMRYNAILNEFVDILNRWHYAKEMLSQALAKELWDTV